MNEELEEELSYRLYNNKDWEGVARDLQQENTQLKMQTNELEKWAEAIKYKDVNFCLNGTTREYRIGYNEAVEEILSKLKEAKKDE